MNDKDFTILYYTSSREEPHFEARIREILLRTSGNRFPIVSVSQKPIDFGANICVGDQGACEINLYRQVLTGCKAIQTPFVISAEADNLYPPDYFTPPDNLSESEVYRYLNVYVLKQFRSYFFKKPTCEGAQIAGRLRLIDLLERALEGKPEWSNKPTWAAKEFRINPYMPINRQWRLYGSDIPVVSIKTGKGLRGNTWTAREGLKQLPYWGTTKIVREKALV